MDGDRSSDEGVRDRSPGRERDLKREFEWLGLEERDADGRGERGRLVNSGMSESLSCSRPGELRERE